jgi:hypothetical protein
MIPVTVRKWGEWKTIKFPIKNAADKRPSAVPSEPVVVKEEEARTDEAQAVSQTEIEKLSKKVLSYAVEGLVNQVNVREIKLQDTEKQLREVASANRVLQVGITQRTSEFANLSPENALWKQMSEKWQDQEIPDDDCVLKKDYIERHKRVNAMVIEDYVLMHVEIDRLGGEYQNVRDQVAREQRAREQAEVETRELAAEGRAAQREIQILTGQVAREQRARERAEAEARELAAEGRAAQREIQILTDQVAREQRARERSEAEARELAAEGRAAQGQVAEVQGHNDTLTQANNTLRTRVEELQNQQNETQQRNNALEAQRRADVDLILAILDAHQLRENILAYQYNALLRQYDITRNDNEQLVQALVNTVNRHEDELAIVLCQMAEIAHIPGANGTNPRRSQPRSRPELRLVQHGSQRYSEYVKSCPSLDLSSNISEHVSLRCFLPGR